jgi:hypothetical protein
MKKEIKFSLVYRDMWQSSGKYQPRADQLAKIAPLIVEMGCFARVETNGGAFEQVNLLYGENPNKAVRTFTKPLREAGIQTHMLDRGLNALRMYPVPADVRRLMYRVKHAQGVDITRIFCGLNEVRNIIPSIFPSIIIHLLTVLVQLIRIVHLRIFISEFVAFTFRQFDYFRSQRTRQFSTFSQNHIPCMVIYGIYFGSL